LQELGSLGFPAGRAIVLATVDFHDQPDLVANKIGNVRAGTWRRNLRPLI
jgi:hypothetical protein